MVLALAAPSSAAPDRTHTLSRTKTSVSWESAPNVAEGPAYVFLNQFSDVRCSNPAEACDDTLLLLESAGTLAVSAQLSGPLRTNDFYTFHFDLYRSDIAGSKGAPVGRRSGAVAAGKQTLTATGVRPGYYLVRVTGEEGVGSYSGRATLTPARR